MKCSMRKRPTGTMPLSECKRRSKNECPSPGRSGATPRFTSVGVAVLGTDATIFLFSSVMKPEVFIILTQEKRSQECPRYRIILDFASLGRSEEHTSELQSHSDLVCRLLLEKKNRQRKVLAVREGPP